jgi:hypothetical protein
VSTLSIVGRPRLAGLFHALRGALAWRLLALLTIGIIVPTSVAALPIWRVLGASLDLSPRVPDIARHFDILAFEDLTVTFGREAPVLVGAGMLATVFALLLGPLLTGMVLATASRDRPVLLLALLQSGLSWYGRAFRLWLVSLIPLGVAGGLAALAFRFARRYAEHAVFESRATLSSRSAVVVTVVLFVMAHATIEAGRAELAADAHLRSAWRAWFRGVRRTVRRPLATIGLYAVITLGSLLVATALMGIRLWLNGASWLGFSCGVIVTQLAAASIAWGRVSRILALTALAHSDTAAAFTHSAASATE